MPEMVKPESSESGKEEGNDTSSTGVTSKATILAADDPYSYTVDDAGTISVISEDGTEMALRPGIMEQAVREALKPLAKGTPAYDLLMKEGASPEMGTKSPETESAEMKPAEESSEESLSSSMNPLDKMREKIKSTIHKHMGKSDEEGSEE